MSYLEPQARRYLLNAIALGPAEALQKIESKQRSDLLPLFVCLNGTIFKACSATEWRHTTHVLYLLSVSDLLVLRPHTYVTFGISALLIVVVPTPSALSWETSIKGQAPEGDKAKESIGHDARLGWFQVQ